MTHRRSDRVSDLLKKEIASMLVMGEIKDPRIGFVTITDIELSRDLRQARVFFTTIGEPDDVEKTKEGLRSAVPYIRRMLGQRLDLRNVPTVEFAYDSSLKYAIRIEEVIKEIKEKGG